MGYTFVINIVNLKTEFHLKHFECNNDEISIFSQQKHLILETEICDFLKIFLRFS